MTAHDNSGFDGARLPVGAFDPSRMLAVIPPVEPAAGGPRHLPAAPKSAWRARLVMAASVALVVGAASAATIIVTSRQSERLSANAEATQSVAKSLAALNARLDSVEKTKSRDDAGDLKRAVGEIKSNNAKDIDTALARLSQRLDSLDRQQSAKVDKLDQAADARGADVAQRLDRLEKKLASAAPPPPAPPKLGPNVSMETTGSIKPASPKPTSPNPAAGPVVRDRPVLSGYVVLGASPNAAVIADRWGERAFRVGDVVPGAGRVERIERRGPAWIVRTEAGLIPAAQLDPTAD